MKFSQDQDRILKISQLVTRALLNDDYDVSVLPGYSWVSRRVSTAPDQDWNNETVFNDNVADIIQAAKKWMKKKGFEPVQREVKNRRAVSSTSVGQTYGIVTVISPFVAEIRTRIWGHANALFDSGEYEKAWQWLEETCKRDERGFFKTLPQTYNLKLTITTRGRFEAISQIVSYAKRHSNAKPSRAEAQRLAKSIKDFLENSLTTLDELKFHSVWFDPERSRTLTVKFSAGKTESLATFPGTKLRALQEGVADLLSLTVWWSEDEALKYLMLGEVPKAGIHIKGGARSEGSPKLDHFLRRIYDSEHQTNDSYWKIYNEVWDELYQLKTADELEETNPSKNLKRRRPKTKHLGPDEIVIRVKGPSTVREVGEQYDEFLTTQLLTPKKLSHNHQKLIQLVYETPELSWSKRYKKWLELCRLDAELTNYGSPTNAARVATLHKEYQRALKRLGWRQKDFSLEQMFKHVELHSAKK